MTVQILDIYQGNPFDIEQEINTGTDAVLIKAGQGEYQDYIESRCNYIEQCEHAGLPWGVFWQMDARHSPESHKRALEVFEGAIGFGSLGLWLACEKPFYPCPDLVYSRMKYAYYKPIESVWRGMFTLTGRYPGIYTSPGMWNLIFGRCPPALQKEIAGKSKLWVAQYKVPQPDRIGQWPDYWFWQYQESPDYSISRISEAQFKLMYKDESPQPPVTPVEPPLTGAERDSILDEAIKAIESLKEPRDPGAGGSL